MMLYKNTKVKVHFLDRDTDCFNIVASVPQGDTLAPYLFIICLDYLLWTFIDRMKDNGFKLAKERSRRYPAQTITDVDYADDIALLANTPAQAETQLYSLEWAVAGIGCHVNADKMEYMCFNQRSNISTLNGSSLKLVNKFTYLGSSLSSTETDINKWLAKEWTAIDRLSVIWKSNRCPWCNGYRRRNWTRRHEFKSWIDCISHSTNTLGKGMNPIILPPAMGK